MTTAAGQYAAQVEAALDQRTRLVGRQPPGDLFGNTRPGSALLRVDLNSPLSPVLASLAEFLQPDDVVIDVGGGAGRFSLPLASACRGIVNVDISAGMGAAFLRNAASGAIANASFVEVDWLQMEPLPIGSVALVDNVTYFTSEIVEFLERLEKAGRRREMITVGVPTPPCRRTLQFKAVHGEDEVLAPGLEALVAVLWEMGRLPDVRVLPSNVRRTQTFATREEAVQAEAEAFPAEQWAVWPNPSLIEKAKAGLAANFDEVLRSVPMDTDSVSTL